MSGVAWWQRSLPITAEVSVRIKVMSMCGIRQKERLIDHALSLPESLKASVLPGAKHIHAGRMIFSSLVVKCAFHYIARAQS